MQVLFGGGGMCGYAHAIAVMHVGFAVREKELTSHKHLKDVM